ncbi:MAG: phosphoribosyltransferase family protein [Actinomycetes bacterium]
MSLLDELRARGVVRDGHFELTSHLHASQFLQCTAALQDTAFARRVGRQLVAALGELEVDVVAAPGVSSIVLGFEVAAALGRRFVFAEERDDSVLLRRGQRVSDDERVLVVEDVLTTGRSAAELGALVEEAGGNVAGYAALVDRSTPQRPLPFEATSLVQVALVTYEPADCPHCADGLPATDPTA